MSVLRQCKLEFKVNLVETIVSKLKRAINYKIFFHEIIVRHIQNNCYKYPIFFRT